MLVRTVKGNHAISKKILCGSLYSTFKTSFQPYACYSVLGNSDVDNSVKQEETINKYLKEHVALDRSSWSLKIVL